MLSVMAGHMFTTSSNKDMQACPLWMTMVCTCHYQRGWTHKVAQLCPRARHMYSIVMTNWFTESMCKVGANLPHRQWQSLSCCIFSYAFDTCLSWRAVSAVTADGRLLNYTTLKTKIASLMLKQPSSPTEKRFKAMPSMRESAAVSCNLERVLLVPL